MDRHLKRIKHLADEINAAISDSAASSARSAHEIMSRFKQASLRESVDARLLGRTSFSMRECVNRLMGQQLGHFIASTLDFASTAHPPRASEYMLMDPSGTVEFRADVYVLTREQFEAALRDAHRAGGA